MKKQQTSLCKPLQSYGQTLKVIREHWHFLQEDTTVGHLFPNPPLMAYRMNTNLRNKLVRAKLPPSSSTETVSPDTVTISLDHSPVHEHESSSSIGWHQNVIHFCPIRSCFLHKILNTSLR